MNKHTCKDALKSPWTLAGIILATTVVLAIIIYILVTLLNLGEGSMGIVSILGTMAGARLAGYMYSYYRKELLSNSLRHAVSGIYAGIQVVFSLFYLVFGGFPGVLFFVLVVVITALISYGLVYWIIPQGNRDFFKAMEIQKKRDAKKKKK